MSVRNDILQELLTKVGDLKDSDLYPTVLSEISTFDENVTSVAHRSVPMLQLIDTGQEDLEVDDGAQQRFSLQLAFVLYVKSETKEEIWEKLNLALTSVRQFIFSDPTIHANALALLYQGIQDHAFHKDGKQAQSVIYARLIYCCDSGSY